MDSGSSALTAIFGAVASCFLVHLGFTYFGVEEWFHNLGPGFAGTESLHTPTSVPDVSAAAHTGHAHAPLRILPGYEMP